jgi:hypothetical protein
MTQHVNKRWLSLELDAAIAAIAEGDTYEVNVLRSELKRV